MKGRYFLIIAMFLSLNLFAQTGKYSIGVVTSRFSNATDLNKITKINNPNGFGIILGKQLNKEAALAFTVEYFDGNFQNIYNEKNYRAHLSLYFKPFVVAKLAPYFSAGIVAAFKKYNSDKFENQTQLFGRFGFGVDYNLINNLFLNADMGFYSDGLKYSGVSMSIGLRFSL